MALHDHALIHIAPGADRAEFHVQAQRFCSEMGGTAKIDKRTDHDPMRFVSYVSQGLIKVVGKEGFSIPELLAIHRAVVLYEPKTLWTKRPPSAFLHYVIEGGTFTQRDARLVNIRARVEHLKRTQNILERRRLEALDDDFDWIRKHPEKVEKIPVGRWVVKCSHCNWVQFVTKLINPHRVQCSNPDCGEEFIVEPIRVHFGVMREQGSWNRLVKRGVIPAEEGD